MIKMALKNFSVSASNLTFRNASATRLGYFYKIMITNFPSKIAQLFEDFLGNCCKWHFSVKLHLLLLGKL